MSTREGRLNSSGDSSQRRAEEIKRSNKLANKELKANIQDYLHSLPKEFFQKLFQSPASCLAVYRMLTPMAKQLVMSNLFTSEKILLEVIQTWFDPSARDEIKEAMKQTIKLQVFKLVEIQSDGEKSGAMKRHLEMTEEFRTQFKNALCGSGQANVFGQESISKDKHPMTIAALDKHAKEKREHILHFMVGSKVETKINRKGSKVKELLERSGLMSSNNRDGVLRISNRGFQFLLMDISSQIWIFLLQYLDLAKEHKVEVLNLYFVLGSLQLGKDYSMEALTDQQQKIVRDLVEFGIVYQRKPGSTRFYPTRLATTLMSGNLTAEMLDESLSHTSADPELAMSTNLGLDGDSLPAGHRGFIIVETNYRLFAYTKSLLQVDILNLFVNLKHRFNNVVIGYLDRDSVRQAFLNGITADQIVHYLRSHADPQMHKFDQVLPLTVVDQIRLWELEKNRVDAKDGVLWNGFRSNADFTAITKFAEQKKCVIYVNVEKHILVVTPEGNRTVVEYARNILNSGQHDNNSDRPNKQARIK